MQITPVPIIIRQSESKCPECGKSEKIIEVCKHCGYEYEQDEEEYSWTKIILITIGILIVVWLLASIMAWAVDQDLNTTDKTFIEYVKDQGIYLKSLSKKLW